MPRFAAYFGGTRRYARCVPVDITPTGERNRLCAERLAIRFPAHFRFRFGAGASFRRAGARLRMMAFRYTPGEASQFTHGCDLFGCPLACELEVASVMSCRGRRPYFCPSFVCEVVSRIGLP